MNNGSHAQTALAFDPPTHQRTCAGGVWAASDDAFADVNDASYQKAPTITTKIPTTDQLELMLVLPQTILDAAAVPAVMQQRAGGESELMSIHRGRTNATLLPSRPSALA